MDASTSVKEDPKVLAKESDEETFQNIGDVEPKKVSFDDFSCDFYKEALAGFYDFSLNLSDVPVIIVEPWVPNDPSVDLDDEEDV